MENTERIRKIAILGSTGSIGTQTLEIVRANPDLQVLALAAGNNVKLMEEQIREFKPLVAGMWSQEAAADLRQRVADLPVKIVAGMDGLLEIAVLEQVEVLVTAIVGMIGIRPTIAAIEAGKDIALANKETLVCAGHIIMPLPPQTRWGAPDILACPWRRHAECLFCRWTANTVRFSSL